MLQAMRSGAKSLIIKFFLFGLLVLATLGLAVMDVQGMFRNGANKTYVAKVDGRKISNTEFDRLVQTTLQRQKIPRAEAYRMGLPLQMLQQEINTRVFSLAAHDLGLIPDDASAARQIKTILKPLTDKGVSQKDALKQLLMNHGLSERELVGTLKSEMAVEFIASILGTSAYVPQQMVTDAMKFRHEWRRGEYITLTAADVAKIGEPSEEDLKQTYQAMSQQFMQPERRTLAVLTIDRKSLGIENKPVTDADVQKYYTDNQKEFGTPEKRKISQANAKDEETAKKIAADKNGNGAKFVSGTYSRNDLIDELAEPVFSGKAGETLPPVQSKLGWHVIKIEKIEPAQVKSFESVKADIRKKLEMSQGSEAVYAKANEIDDMIAGGKGLSEVAQEYGLKEKVFEGISADEKLDGKVAMGDKVMASAFALNKGEASQLIETQDGDFIVVEVRDITAAAPKPLDTVRSEVIAGWKAGQLAQALQKKSEEISERVKLGEGLDKVAASMNKPLSRTDLIQRGDAAAEKYLPSGLPQALFAIDDIGQTIGVPGKGMLYILRLAERKVEVPKNVKEEDRKTVESILLRSMRNDLIDQYRQSLLDKYDVVINDETVARNYNPKDQQNQAY